MTATPFCGGDGQPALASLKKFTYSQARQRLSAVLDTARKEEVVITRRGGDSFHLSYRKTAKSPFDVPGITTGASTQDILNAVRESREK
jgi:prevent-host-death family protein